MRSFRSSGVTLIETIVFLVVVSIALVALVRVYTFAVSSSVDPAIRTRALELAQAQLDEVLARKFDEATPTGGVPACNTTAGPLCLGISADTDYDDIGDYNGFVNNTDPYHTLTVSVSVAGADLGLPADQARLISVTSTIPGGDSLVLSVYKTNF
ncbi:MAG: type II secretion system GspH family protein [Agarilytica sp.]